MKNIPIEFLPGFWVSLPTGLEGQGSGFLLAEGLRSVFTIGIKIPISKNYQRNWSIVSISEKESRDSNYLSAFVRLLTESWLDTESVILVSDEGTILRVMRQFMVQVGGVKDDVGEKMIRSKISMI